MKRGAVGILVAAMLLAGAAPAYAAAPAKKKAPVKVTVLEFEYGFKLSRKTMPAGKVTFVMGNGGTIPHNFDLLRNGHAVLLGPFLVSGQQAVRTVTLRKGTYTYVCSVKYHAAQGMQGTLQVT